MKHTSSKQWQFALRIIFPVVLVITLFLVAFYAIIIPEYKHSIMERKAEMIKELTNSAWSVLNKYHADERSGFLTSGEAKKEAAARIEYLRYGPDGKDYFWITDMHPLMVMHPYRKDLNGQDLSGFADPHGKHLFVEFVRVVQQSGTADGFVDYMWQWKDDTAHIVPKLSYVKAFKPWGWVIGTGIYLEDVGQQIKTLERGLLRVVFGITMIVAVLLMIIAAQSYRIEQKRQKAEEKTRRSEEKYRTLVEATSEGTMMMLAGSVVYSNKIIQDLAGYSEQELAFRGLAGLIVPQDAERVTGEIDKVKQVQNSPVSLVTSIIKSNGDPIRVDMSISLLPLGNDLVHVVIINPVNKERLNIQAREDLTAELQASVLLLSRQISELPRRYLSIGMMETIAEAARKMTEAGRDAILVCSEQNKAIGIITDEDIRKRFVAQGLPLQQPVYTIMSAPLISVSEKALLYEAIATMQEFRISHLAVRNPEGDITGIASHRELLQIHQYSLSFVKREIEGARSVSEIRKISQRIPDLTSSLIKSGADPAGLVRFTAIIFDAIVEKFIRLALEELGEPPAPFAYLVMGSAGREEQTLATDQDNAIIFQDPEPEQSDKVREYFLNLGTLVSEWLDEAGYRYCNGLIMASNLDWCLPAGNWNSRISRWIRDCEPKDLMEMSIFFDYRCVFGDRKLADSLHLHIQDEIKHNLSFFIFLTGNIQKHKTPLSLFGNIQVGGRKEQPEAFDIKLAMLPIVDMARLYALKEGVEETGTLPRLLRLYQLGVFSETEYYDRIEAYRALLSFRLKHQVEQIMSGSPADNFINPDKLTNLDQVLLKKVFAQVNEFIAKLGLDFKNGLTT